MVKCEKVAKRCEEIEKRCENLIQVVKNRSFYAIFLHFFKQYVKKIGHSLQEQNSGKMDPF